MKELEYHRRVQQGYEQLIQAEPDRWHKVDANRSLDQVQDDIRRKVLSVLEDRS
jgi:thymidylate kinase